MNISDPMARPIEPEDQKTLHLISEKKGGKSPETDTKQHPGSPDINYMEKSNDDEQSVSHTDDTDHYVDSFAADPFTPFDDLPEERSRVLTVRAVIVGLVAGTLVNASNVYLGLKSGWTFTANLLGAIMGFGVLKFFAAFLPDKTLGFGGSFGPRENNIVQTTAVAAGGLSNVFVSAFPAMYQLKLLDTPAKDFWRITALTAVGGYFGFFFATPLRKFFIIYIAREMKLVFPTASATALTIRSMHDAVRGQEAAKKKMMALGAAFGFAFILRVISQYALGIVWEWHFFTWFYIWGHYRNLAIHVENWGWFVQFTPAFIGSGMLVGMNVSISFLMGSVLAWGIIGPLLVHNNVAFGTSPFASDPDLALKWGEVTSFYSLGAKASSKYTPSPRYWLLWPGVLAMIAVSFTELLLQWRIIIFAFKAIYRASATALYDAASKRGKEYKFLKVEQQDETDLVQDPARPEEIPKMWMWMPGLLLTIIGMCLVMGLQYDMPAGMSLLSVFLAFFFSFLAIQCTGVTDITPLTAASKASQVILGGATKSNHWNLDKARRLNLIGGAIANMGANQSTDLVADFRVGFLLHTPPNQQWIAQGIGTLAAVFIAPSIFQLFMTAYPCVIAKTEPCPFTYPSVAAWNAVAVAVTDPEFPIPKSSGIFSIVFAVFGSLMVLIRHYLWVEKLAWARTWHPNMMCVALAFVLPQTFYGTAMVIGSTIACIWAKKIPKSFDMIGYAVAAGLIAGEGIGGVVNAVLQIAKKSGDYYGVDYGCPGPKNCAG